MAWLSFARLPRVYGLPIAAASACLSIAGCMVGPNFEKPAAPDVSGYASKPAATTESTPNVAGGEAQKFGNEHDVVGDWWTLFHSKQLDDLIEEALAKNHDLKSAQAALKVAHATVLA